MMFLIKHFVLKFKAKCLQFQDLVNCTFIIKAPRICLVFVPFHSVCFALDISSELD